MWRFTCIPLLLSTQLLTSLTVVTRSAQAQTFKVIYSFTGGEDGYLPRTGLTIDAAGNLYGTTSQGGDGYGTVFGCLWPFPVSASNGA